MDAFSESKHDDHRDFEEELDNAMTPFRENGTKVFDAGYSMDDLFRWANLNPSKVQVIDDNGDIAVSLGLTTAPDGSLWRFSEDKVYPFQKGTD